jgi:predicted alpha/beta-fold hydrolase
VRSQVQLPRIKKIHPLETPFWANSGHLQTLSAHLIPSEKFEPKKTSPLEYTIPLQDGDAVKAYFSEGKKKVIVCMFHGLGGDILSDYMQRTAILASELELGVLLVNHRGAQSGIRLAKNPYHSGRGEDISDVIGWLRKKFPDHFLIAVGISMSGCMLLNLASGMRGHEKPDAMITVNAPLNLQKGSVRLSQGFNRVYDFRFVRKLNQQIQLKKKLGLIQESYSIPLFATLHEFDKIYTAKASGFQDREDYYSRCSPHANLERITIPTIMLHALDDPFVPVEDYLSAKVSSSVQLHVEKHGGHVGYYSGPALTLRLPHKNRVTHRWLDYFLCQSLQDLLSDKNLF